MSTKSGGAAGSTRRRSRKQAAGDRSARPATTSATFVTDCRLQRGPLPDAAVFAWTAGILGCRALAGRLQ